MNQTNQINQTKEINESLPSLNNAPLNRPEFKLLLCCARTRIDEEKAGRIKLLVKDGLDWDFLLQLARRHGVMPLLYRALNQAAPHSVPSAVLNQLSNHYYLNASRNLFLTEELQRIVRLFEFNGILALPNKGPALAESLYGDIASREFADLDILVQRKDIQKATELMISSGYDPQFKLTPKQVAAYFDVGNEIAFLNKEGKCFVELQWEIVPGYFVLPISSLFSWDEVKRAGSGFLSLPPEETLLVLCVHGAKDLWNRLIWICDIAELLYTHRNLDWEKIINLATALGSRRMLFLGLHLANELLEAPLPEQVGHQIETDGKMKKLGGQVVASLAQKGEGLPGLLETCLFYVRVRERMKEKIRFCLRFATQTTPGDWTFLRLPDFLSPVHYLIRPIRLALKYGLKSFKRDRSVEMKARLPDVKQ
jgi:hypothetical protein